MKTLIPLAIFIRSAPSSSSPSPHFLSSHFLLFYSTSTKELQTKRAALAAAGGRGSSHPFSSSSESDDPSRNVKVSVWWDFENCSIPNGVNALKTAKNITCALRAKGIKGPVTITAFGDFIQYSRGIQESLSATGVSLNHVPSGGKNTPDRSLLADLVFWVSQNPPPAHLFLISGDKDFANILHRLRMNNYNILLASKDPAPYALCSAASIMWHWNDLVRGENFSGKHFNEPPDGPLESWYDHNREPLEDLLPDMIQLTCVHAEDSPDAVAGSKPHAVPKAIVNQICQVVNSYPKGVYIAELRSQLEKSNVPLDKDFFGHKKFSILLKSLHTVLKVQSAGDGQMFVYGIQPKNAEPVCQPKFAGPVNQPKVAEPIGQPKVAEPHDRPKVAEPHDRPKIAATVEAGDSSRIETTKLNGKKKVVTTDVNGKSSLPAYSPPKVDQSPVGPKENGACLMEGHLSPMEQNDSISEVGFLPRARRTVFGHNGDPSNKKTNNFPEICSTNADSFEKTEPEEKPVSCPASSSNLKESVLEEKTSTNSGVKDESIQRVGMLSKIVNWFRSLKTSANTDNTSRHFVEEVNQMNTQTDNNELFSKVAFWEDMLSFLHTPKGAALISQSKTREHMAQQLQMEGPTHLNTLDIGELSHLVDLLITEKKWMEESISRTFPFKLIHPAPVSSSSYNPHSSNELSSIFSVKSSQSNLQRPPSHEGGNGKDTQVGVCSDETNKKPCGKSKSEVLGDCQKLVAEMFKEQPEGFYINKFRTMFRERYGYDLEYQKLGYSKLAALLQTIRGVDIDFNYVLPCEKSSKIVIPYSVENDGTVKASNSDSELFNSTKKHNDNDSVWEELGPISETKSKANSLGSGINKETNEGIEHVDFDDNSYLSDEFSDSDGESPIKDLSDGKRLTKKTEKRLTTKTEKDSGLELLLGSLCNENDRGINDKNEIVDFSRIDLKPSSETRAGSTFSFQKRVLKKPRRTYSFISNTVADEPIKRKTKSQ